MNVILLGSQFLAENSNGNFLRTVLKSVNLAEYSQELNETDKLKMEERNVSIHKSYSMWAVNQKYKSIFKKIAPGDIVLFYSRNRYHHCAKVKYVFEGLYPEIAESLWKEAKYDQLFILEDLSEIDFSREVVHENMGEKIEDRIISGIKIASNPNPEFVRQLPLVLSRRQNLISGDKGTTDKIAKKDYLSRKNLIKKVAQFYVGFTQKSIKSDTDPKETQLFLGVFGKWGKGKSSFIHLLHEEVSKQAELVGNKNQTYILANIDCSLIDQKETLWLNILNSIIGEMEQKRKEIKNKEKKNGSKELNPFNKRTLIKLPGLSSYELRFNLNNIGKVLLGKKLLIVFYIVLGCLTFLLIDPPSEFKLDLKNTSGIITLTMLLVTIIKTFNLKLGQIFLPNKYTQTMNSYFKSKDEFEQLLQITDRLLKKDHSIRILITLDEIDRMNKNLLPELMECLQLFKGIKQTNRVSLQFLLSFNHDIVFPHIGKSLTMNDPYLFVNSFPESFLIRDTVYGTTRINSYQLGKEYMDKYLDLSIYLDDVPSYNDLVDKIFSVDNEMNLLDVRNTKNENININYLVNMDEKNGEIAETKEDYLDDNSSREYLESEIVSSFTFEEISLIKNAVEKQKEYVEPRKLIRLNNALILIKNLDLDNSELTKESEIELASFVSEFLNDLNISLEDGNITQYNYQIFKSAHFFLDKRSHFNPESKKHLNMLNQKMNLLFLNKNNEKKSGNN
ncbi:MULTISPECIES: P-loop NTPase fold protein [unclassified Exiguobacterium]|uniref:P-loop NTPase fold protein n=1 Tax=unclassified Exiguobacterium TaxID=2644629 RepID=UPI001BE69302|nr:MULTISPECIES: P-loop NTPase fold protein [unclassified Exiguobacterium]